MPDEARPWNDAREISCEFVFRCPRTWDQFTPTEQENIRHCPECDRDVHLVQTEADFRRHAEGGHCVAVRVVTPDQNEGKPVSYVGSLDDSFYRADLRKV